ncbi:MAG: cupredoxin domain-containing protein [archaeon]
MKQAWWVLMTVGLLVLFGGYVKGFDFGAFPTVDGFGSGVELKASDQPSAQVEDKKTFAEIESEFGASQPAPFVVLASGNEPDEAASAGETLLLIRKFRFTPDRIRVSMGDIVRLKIASGDYNTAHSFALDEYGVYVQVPAGKDRMDMTVVEFKADNAGTFTYYCNEFGHSEKGTLVVTE